MRRGPKHDVDSGWKAGSDNRTPLVGRTRWHVKNDSLKFAFEEAGVWLFITKLPV